MIFRLLGKLLFPRLQEWEQAHKVKTLAVAVCVGLVVGGVIVLISLKRAGIGK